MCSDSHQVSANASIDIRSSGREIDVIKQLSVRCEVPTGHWSDELNRRVCFKPWQPMTIFGVEGVDIELTGSADS